MMRDHRDDPDATTRADCCRLLAMVGELHARGYQRIRACPSLSGSGGYWRCSITAADNVTSSGVVIVDFDRGAHYTSGSGDCYFAWSDLAGASPDALADAFAERFGEIAAAGRGADPDYAAWFAELLSHAGRGHFPIALADFELPADRLTFVAGPGVAHEEIVMPFPQPSDRSII